MSEKHNRQLATERKQRVLSVIRSRGSFEVSWRYHDEPLMRTCRTLCKRGVLRVESDFAGRTVFVAAKRELLEESPKFWRDDLLGDDK